jgi:large subunit ribosomal protein L21
MIAVIQAGGKQYLIKEGDLITVNKIKSNSKINEEIIFDRVLLVYDDQKNELFIGQPLLSNFRVTGQIIKEIKKKIQIIKFKPKTRYKKKLGYKNYFTQIKITKIEKI